MFQYENHINLYTSTTNLFYSSIFLIVIQEAVRINMSSGDESIFLYFEYNLEYRYNGDYFMEVANLGSCIIQLNLAQF